MTGPDPNTKHPMAGFPQVCFIRNTVENSNIIVGEYTYDDDPVDSEGFERNVLYHFPFIGDKLVIGKFCAIARDVRFIMNGANHKLSGISTYPFQIFGNGGEKVMPKPGDLPYKGDTIVGANPAKPIKQRFEPDVVARLESLAWWDWPIETITRHLDVIVAGDVDELARVAPR
jgi:virginiamycin A acetyltransferase